VLCAPVCVMSNVRQSAPQSTFAPSCTCCCSCACACKCGNAGRYSIVSLCSSQLAQLTPHSLLCELLFLHILCFLLQLGIDAQMCHCAAASSIHHTCCSRSQHTTSSEFCKALFGSESASSSFSCAWAVDHTGVSCLMPASLVKHLAISSRSVVPSLTSLRLACLQHCLQQGRIVNRPSRQQQLHWQARERLQVSPVRHPLRSSASMKDDPDGVTEEAALLEAFSEVPTISGAWVHSAGAANSILTVRSCITKCCMTALQAMQQSYCNAGMQRRPRTMALHDRTASAALCCTSLAASAPCRCKAHSGTSPPMHSASFCAHSDCQTASAQPTLCSPASQSS
jgi:hypothetical protein